jgi:hypothetical protein
MRFVEAVEEIVENTRWAETCNQPGTRFRRRH